MKLNKKLFMQLNSEPVSTQEIDGRVLSFYHMDEAMVQRYASKGRFALWTSDGKDYKVLLEPTYHEAMTAFYAENVNKIWIDFLEHIGQKNRKTNLKFMIPLMIFYVSAALVSSIFFQDQLMTFLLMMLAVVFISNMFQNRIIRKQIQDENIATQNKIKEALGEKAFEALVLAQENHYKTYFNIDESLEEGDNNDKK